MMKIINKALFSYFGNKDREIKQIMENSPGMNNIDIIIEPDCGSVSLIGHLILLVQIRNIYVLIMIKN